MIQFSLLFGVIFVYSVDATKIVCLNEVNLNEHYAYKIKTYSMLKQTTYNTTSQRLRWLFIVIAAALLVTFCAAQLLPNRAFAASTIQVTNNTLLFKSTVPVTFALQGTSGESVDWTVKDSNDTQVSSGTTTNGTVEVKDRLSVGYYTLSLQSASNTPTTISFGVIMKPSYDRFYGTKTLTAHSSSLYRSDYARILPMISDLGFSTRRDSVYWAEYEPDTKGVYSTPAVHQNILNIDTSLGTDFIWTAGRQNSLYGNSTYPSTTDEIQGYTDYINAFLTEHPQIKRVEILNEFNGSDPSAPGCGNTPQCYYNIIEVVYPQVKAAHPTVEIIAGGTVGSAASWLQGLLDLGGGQYMDAYSIHPYSQTPDTMAANTKNISNRIQTATGQKKPVYITEFGYTISGPNSTSWTKIASEQLQAYGLIYAYSAAREGGATALSWYNSINYAASGSSSEGNFGLFYNLANRTNATAYQPKQSAIAFNIMRQKLDGYTYSHLDVLRDDAQGRVNSYVYTKPNGDRMQVVFRSDRNIAADQDNADPTPTPVSIPTNGRTYSYIDSYLNHTILTSSDASNALAYNVSLEPIYVESTNTERPVESPTDQGPGAPNTGFFSVKTVSPALLLAAVPVVALVLFATIKNRLKRR